MIHPYANVSLTVKYEGLEWEWQLTVHDPKSRLDFRGGVHHRTRDAAIADAFKAYFMIVCSPDKRDDLFPEGRITWR
jgi:hypothetical protein